MAELEQSGVDAETLDRVDVLFNVKVSFLITAGVYSGVPDRDTLAELIMERGVYGDDIDEVSIFEVQVDNQVVARA